MKYTKIILLIIGLVVGIVAITCQGKSPESEFNMVIDYKQKPLPYDYNQLEPSIDAMTMEIHYTRHAAGYAKNLMEAVEAEGVDINTLNIESLLGTVSNYSVKMRNNGGGHYNHELFWAIMTPGGKQIDEKSSLYKAILRDFGSFESFKEQFENAAKTRFGSGWAWLVVNDGKLAVGSTPNQDNPLMDVSDFRGTPILGLDVWEHAYYLKYQNKRPEYISSWWNVVNWPVVEELYQKALK